MVAENLEEFGIHDFIFELLDCEDSLRCQEKSIVNADLTDCLGIFIEALFYLTPNLAMAFLESHKEAKNDCLPRLDHYC